MSENRITLTCGHRVASIDQGVDVIIKSWDYALYNKDEGPRYLRYAYVCQSCRDEYRKEGVILETEQEAMAWLQNDNDIVYRLQRRAEIRRTIADRKSVVEGKPDRISDLLEEAAKKIIELRGY
jgi:hypothetical protein